ncbi:MAG: amidohydrolase family protein [Gammaproteobacteria bacterium]|nr:amidohydrolase family protein [Gammaproteobacteria bacterium]
MNRARLPGGACDCHMHVFDRRFAPLPDAMYREATAQDYLALAARLCVQRTVVVQPSGYGFDSRCTLDAVAALGAGARAIVVVAPDTTESELRRLHAAGARGVRFMLLRPGGLGWEQLAPMAEAVAPLGWHLNLQFDGREMPARLDALRALPVDVVIDHLGAFVGGIAPNDPAFRALLQLLEGGRAWVKLSGPYTYRMSAAGHPDYPEAATLARLLASEFPDRCLWASDWPHVSEPGLLPDDALARVTLGWIDAIGGSAAMQRIGVDNPARLYGFAPGDLLNTKETP